MTTLDTIIIEPKTEDLDSIEDPEMQAGLKAGSQMKIGGGDADDFEAWMRSRQLAKPEDQLELTDAELTEEVTKVLTPTNSNVIHNLVVYSFKEEAFVLVPPAGNTVTLFYIDGDALHIDSEEAKNQVEELGEPGLPLPLPKHTIVEHVEEKQDFLDNLEDEDQGAGPSEKQPQPKEDKEAIEDEAGDEEGEEEEGEEATGVEGDAAEQVEEEEEDDKVQEESKQAAMPGKKRKLINQFNFCERAALTYTNPKRNVETQTIPPPRSSFGATALQWVIYDSYMEDFEQQQKEKEKKDDKKPQALKKKEEEKLKKSKTMEAEDLNRRYLRAWQILERMINQNIFDEIANDYRYWEDPADEFRENEGTLLPLWKFQYERTKRFSVTDVLFNPHYYDLFAVCFGSYDFMKQPNEGAVCLFTIKNPSFPDYIIVAESGVMCCDIHKNYPFLIVLGMYDGNVAVYNLKESLDGPLYLSVGVNNKHSECVWEVKWGPDMVDGEINFYSVSSSGQVYNWVLMQHKLVHTTINTLFLENGIIEGPDGTDVQLRSCGSCMKFHPNNPEIYLIGTEEGLIYKCSIAFSSKYVMTYYAHNLSIYRLDFNRYNSNIFISCSGDWRVKIWEDMRPEPLFIFDLGSAVGDVKWAPFSSTVFAACTTDGKVFVFDLNVNKYKPICSQAVVPKRKNRLTRIAFNEKLPFVIVGDDKGTVTSLKLSPNLRLMVKPPKKQLYLDQNTLQTQKLEKLLSLVRELPEGFVIQDTATTVQS